MRLLAAAAALAAVAGCDVGLRSTPVPQSRPATAQPAPHPPSGASRDLALYYGRVQNDLLAQGLMRVDGGGPDTPFTAEELAANFERIAFFDEYERGAGLTRSRGTAGQLRRWIAPVRMQVEFGDNVPADQRGSDRAEVTRYAARLGRVTGHTVTEVANGGNFHVLFMSEDDHAGLPARVRSIVPDIDPGVLEIFRDMPRSIHCFVVAFSAPDNGQHYAKAIALIRTEHPTLLRRSCIHEELAQGMGLANDSPRARPSIFNDDDEFALLTTHDEMLLRMLYDPRLTPGMTLAAARPTIRRMAEELVGPAS